MILSFFFWFLIIIIIKHYHGDDLFDFYICEKKRHHHLNEWEKTTTTTIYTNKGHIWILGWWNCSFKINNCSSFLFCFCFSLEILFVIKSNQIDRIDWWNSITILWMKSFFFLFDFISCFYYEWLIDLNTTTIRWWWWWVTMKLDNWKGILHTKKIKFRNSFLCALSEFLKSSFHFVHAIIMIKWI